ncbi:hypothetical protein LINPERPRIM_LOCUS8536 [Linum perenne]
MLTSSFSLCSWTFIVLESLRGGRPHYPGCIESSVVPHIR